MMTSVPLFRTPASSPPKFSSSSACSAIHGANLAIGAAMIRNFHPSDLEPVKFISSQQDKSDVDTSDQKNLLSPTSPNSKNQIKSYIQLKLYTSNFPFLFFQFLYNSKNFQGLIQ